MSATTVPVIYPHGFARPAVDSHPALATMGAVKLVKKNLTPLLVILFLALIIGTLAWDIVERIFAQAGMPFSLSTGRIGFDVDVLALYVRVNPGSFLGAAGGVLLFRSL